ncbi:TonB dependent receptor [Enhygromyxa salina]|uniref:TonB dependent receptor n=1 Tax=Enhygromyxa salina TaxID=215803 RepID=A0A2S9YE34_9BACT|nr:TonB-dependent receptor [Enhygromyxa salina]PRQ03292.1 TonB dependent receptor [Enhygromyxa salina]
MRRPALTAILGVVGAQIVMVSTAEAGPNDAVLTGVVRDPETKEGIEGAIVVVTGEKLQGERSMVTDATGLYRIPDLPPGTYEVLVLHADSRPRRREELQLRAGQTTRINFTLQRVEDEPTTLIVSSPPVDTTSSSTGFAIDSEMARRVPIAQPTGKGGANRSFEAVAEATPGAAGDLYGTSIAGTSSPENKYYIDGLSVNDPGFGLNGTSLTVEFLEDVRVEAGGYMPEFGRATGGILNAVTKSGSNEFHGGVWAYYSPGRLEGYRKQPVREGATIQAERQLLWLGDTGFDFGGRIVRDKLWFYGGVSISRTAYDIATTWNRLVVDPDTGEVLSDAATGFKRSERIPGTEAHRKAQGTTLQTLAKLTYSPAKNHTLELLGIFAPTSSGGNRTFGLDAATGNPEVASVLGTYDSLAHRYRNDAADLQLQWKVLADDNRWDVSTTLGWHYQVNQSMPHDRSVLGSGEGLAGTPGTTYRRNTPEVHSVTDFIDLPGDAASDACDPWVDPVDASRRTITCPATLFRVGGPGFINDRRLSRVQFRSNAARLAIGAGHHLIKFGLDFEYMQYDSERGYSGTTLYREDPSGQAFLDLRRYGYLSGPDEATILPSLRWRVFSTTIGGYLQDSWSIMDKVTLNVGLRYDAQHLFGGDGRLSMALPNQVSPRVGVIWDPTQVGKAKIFANYARFYQSVPLNLADRAGSGEPSIRRYYDASICDPSDPESHAEDCQSDASRVAIAGPADPDRYWLGYGAGKTAIDPDLRPQSSDEIVAGGEYEILPGARLGVNYTHRWLNRVIEDMSRDEATTYFIGNPGYGIAKDFPKGKRVYDAVIIYFDKRFARSWLVSGSYTLAWLRGNIAGLFRPETGQLDPNINSDFDLVSLLANRFGPLPGDRRHTVKLFAAGEIALGKGHALMLGGAFRASSGAPTNVLGSHEIYGTGEAFLIPRGAGERLPWVFRLDTNIGYRKHFTDDLAVAVTMDVFNVVNFQAVTAVDQSYTYSDVVPIEGGTLADLEGYTDGSGEPIVKNPNFGKPSAYQSPRLFRFGVRLDF